MTQPCLWCRYYCFLVPLMMPMLVIAVGANWFCLKLFKVRFSVTLAGWCRPSAQPGAGRGSGVMAPAGARHQQQQQQDRALQGRPAWVSPCTRSSAPSMHLTLLPLTPSPPSHLPPVRHLPAAQQLAAACRPVRLVQPRPGAPRLQARLLHVHAWRLLRKQGASRAPPARPPPKHAPLKQRGAHAAAAPCQGLLSCEQAMLQRCRARARAARTRRAR